MTTAHTATVTVAFPIYEEMRRKELAHDDLVKALRQCLNFIEHSEANKGKCTTDEQWDANVEAFRKGGTSRIGIGRSYTDKAFIDFTFARAALAKATGAA